MRTPIIQQIAGVTVVRDDLYPGGTKARFVRLLCERGAREIVYGSPAEGGAQYSIAYICRELGKRATIFVARRGERHARYRQIEAMGAKVIEVSPGYLTTVQARARQYAGIANATLLPFGFNLPLAFDTLRAAAMTIGIEPDEVWCAGGSGVLATSLSRAWPCARMNVVRVGKSLVLPERFKLWNYPAPFAKLGPPAPFPSDRNYDAKAWEMCQRHHGPGMVLFWNVLGEP